MNDEIDLEALQTSIRDVLDNECPVDTVQRHVLSGGDCDTALWTRIADLGWLGLSVPASSGGLGLGLDALSLLYRELGRALAPVPVLPTLLAAEAIARLGDPAQQDRWLPQIAAGSLRATISDPTIAPQIHGRYDGGALILNGRDETLLDGMAADLVLLFVDLEGQRALIVLDRNQPGATLERVAVTDQTRHLAYVVLDDARIDRGRLLGDGDIGATVDGLTRHAAIAIAADAVGGADRILSLTVDYLKVREQFGRAIGSFQALKHRAADHKAALTGAEALLEEVAALAGAGTATVIDALEAKALTTSVYAGIARDCIQLHGGIGFTWEYQAHLFLKRALVDTALFGTTECTLDRVVNGLAA